MHREVLTKYSALIMKNIARRMPDYKRPMDIARAKLKARFPKRVDSPVDEFRVNALSTMLRKNKVY